MSDLENFNMPCWMHEYGHKRIWYDFIYVRKGRTRLGGGREIRIMITREEAFSGKKTFWGDKKVLFLLGSWLYEPTFFETHLTVQWESVHLTPYKLHLYLKILKFFKKCLVSKFCISSQISIEWSGFLSQCCPPSDSWTTVNGINEPVIGSVHIHCCVLSPVNRRRKPIAWILEVTIILETWCSFLNVCLRTPLESGVGRAGGFLSIFFFFFK